MAVRDLHLLLFQVNRKYAVICTKSQTIMRKYVHLRIQLLEMHPQQGYLHNCKHSIKFQDFHSRLEKFKFVKENFICANCKFSNIKRIFLCVIGHSF